MNYTYNGYYLHYGVVRALVYSSFGLFWGVYTPHSRTYWEMKTLNMTLQVKFALSEDTKTAFLLSSFELPIFQLRDRIYYSQPSDLGKNRVTNNTDTIHWILGLLCFHVSLSVLQVAHTPNDHVLGKSDHKITSKIILSLEAILCDYFYVVEKLFYWKSWTQTRKPIRKLNTLWSC